MPDSRNLDYEQSRADVGYMESVNLEAKVLREHGTHGPRIDLAKEGRSNQSKSRHLSYRTKIRNKSGFYFEEDT